MCFGDHCLVWRPTCVKASTEREDEEFRGSLPFFITRFSLCDVPAPAPEHDATTTMFDRWYNVLRFDSLSSIPSLFNITKSLSYLTKRQTKRILHKTLSCPSGLFLKILKNFLSSEGDSFGLFLDLTKVVTHPNNF